MIVMDRATLCQLRRTLVDDAASTSTGPALPFMRPLEVMDRIVCRVPVHMEDATATKARLVVVHVPNDLVHVELVSID